MKFLLYLTASLLLVACVYSAPIGEDAPSPPADSSSEEIILIEQSPPQRPETDDSNDAPLAPISIPSEDVEIVAISSSTTKPDNYVDLENIHLSPKLSKLYRRLSNLDPELLQSGVLKFREILLQSKSRDDFLEKLWREKATGSADPTELLQFKSDLNELATFIAEQHPKVLSWFLATVGGARPTTTSTKLSFLEKFSEIDEEMSVYPVWNRYWDYWFQSTGDFIAKWG